MNNILKTKRIISGGIAALCIGFTATNATAVQKENAKWTWSGWGGGGFFWSAVIDPTNADIMYLGGDVVGMYKSVDRGKSWRFINNGLHEYGVYSMAISRSNPKILYAMTPNGMAKTINGGEVWKPLTETLKPKQNLSTHRPGSVRAIAVDPANPEVVYAGSAKGVVCKSTDGGSTWTEIDYLSAIKTTAPKPVQKAASGDGFLWVTFKAAANDWEHSGRIEKYMDKAQDWSSYKKMTASFFAPAGTPPLQVCLVVQTGSGWTWQQSQPVTSKSGDWVDVSFDFTSLKDMNAVHMAHYVVRDNGAAYSGELGIDAIKLHPQDAAAPVVNIGEWDTAAANEGWRTSKAADAPFITAMRQSKSAATQEQAPIASINIADANPNILFVSHRKLGLFRSTDAGKTWMKLETPNETANVAIYPKDPRLVFAAFGKNGIWRSTDGGNTWTKTSTGIGEKYDVREIVIHPTNPKVLHAIASEGWGGQYLTSSDGGETWTHTRKFARDVVGNPTLPADGKNGGELSIPTNLAMSPADPDTLFISANWNNILSSDGGKTWRESAKGADITCFHDLRFVDKQVFAVAMDEGLLTSADNGNTWTQLSPLGYKEGLSGHQWRVAGFKKDNGEYHIVSTVSPWQGSKEYPRYAIVSDDSGKTFKSATGLPDYLPKNNTMWGEGHARALAMDPKDPLTLYLGLDGDAEPSKGLSGGGVFKSTDGGYTWTQLPNQPGTRRMFYGIAVDPTDSKRVFWGGFGANGGVWRSENGGESWERMNCSDAYLFNLEVTNDGTVYAGGNDLWQSKDHGTTWKKISNIPDRKGSVVGIAYDPANANRIWFSSATWDGSSNGGIWRSDDGGKTWVDILGDIPYVKPLIIRYNQKTSELWAAGVGAFRTKQ